MPLTTTGELVTRAAERRSAVASFNIITLEHIEAVIAGAEASNAPVVLQVSENAVTFRRGRLLPLARAAVAAAERAAVPVALHLDHVRSDALLRQAADAGFGSVMYDAARLPYADNLAATRAAVDWAHARGLWIEAELGEIGGKDGQGALDAHAPGARTDPDRARAFVADSGVDALAVAVGTTHAMTTRTARVDHALLERLTAALDVPLVLHGSSGLPDDELAAAVTGGIAKVNVGTALNIAMTGAIRQFLTAHPEAVDSRGYLTVGREAMTRAVAAVIEVLGPAPGAAP
ncbi:ketose-bisphosphate aldolase [Streptomyces sp. NPDC014986]|uniref:class II fructose-bisphosphate aldolase n=1 Tax=unclassified Streptomyces TaxID=2593676 RepID=UPI0036F6D7E5